MNDVTRYARRIEHQGSVREGTRVATRQRVDERWPQLGAMHMRLRSAVLEQHQPGLFILVTAAGRGEVGRLWLSATEDVRVGLIGRHDMVDLQLAFDDELSLRQALFVVRLRDGRARFTVVDLDTPNGLVSSSETPVHLLEAEQPLSFRTGPFSFFCVPTGPGASLPEDPDEAWKLFEAPPERRAATWIRKLWRRNEQQAAGLVSVSSAHHHHQVPIGAVALDRGVLLGRASRCGICLEHDFQVSRVHAVLLTVDGVPHVIDASSTNGLWHGEDEIHCQPLRDDDQFTLGRSNFRWSAAQ